MTEHMTELEFTARKIQYAKSPEEIFGSLTELKNALATYRLLAKITHPDLYIDKADKNLAQSAFIRLTEFWEKAQEKIRGGLISIRVGTREYLIEDRFFETVTYQYYPASFEEDSKKLSAVFKIPVDPIHNDKLVTEAEILATLADSEGLEKFHKYYPKLIDSFKFVDPEDPVPRQVNILSAEKGIFSLEEVKQVYPSGIDPKDMAWIFRRLLAGLGFPHIKGVAHNAIFPKNIFIHPEKHGLVIAEWSDATVEPNSASPKFAMDIEMSSSCMIYLLERIPTDFQSFFSKLMDKKSMRSADAWALLEEFDHLIEKLWGERKFHKFSMPERVTLNAFW